MFYTKFYSDDFIKVEYPNGWVFLTGRTSPLEFRYRYNNNKDCMVEFAIFQDGQQIGGGAQHTMDVKAWVQHFIYDCNFNTWLSQRRVKAV